MDIKTKYLSGSQEDLAIAGEILKNGGTVIIPTETVYGLGANALQKDAVKKIFEAKGRPSDNPLIVHIADYSILDKLVLGIPDNAKKLMDKFWPGPLTLIFKKSDNVPKEVTGGLDTVAIRMPAHPVANKLLALSDVPVAAPSANRSGFPSPTLFEHVKSDMDGRVDAIIDGGACEVGVESTVLDVSGETPILYRPGAVTLEQIEDVIGKINVVTSVKEGEKPKSPGLKYRHYAPKAEVQVLRGSIELVEKYLEFCKCAKKTGMLVFDEFPEFNSDIVTKSLGSKEKSETAAHRLFAVLREMDEEGVELVLAPEIPDIGVWSAVKNRLYRAAGNKVIDLENMKNILFVCTGNTCRSPMAEGIMRKISSERNLSIQAFSAGMAASADMASDNSIKIMEENNMDISAHRSRQLTREFITAADFVLTMTKGQRDMLLLAFPEYSEKIMSLGDWAEENDDVADPYGGDIEAYRFCYNQIYDYITKGCQG